MIAVRLTVALGVSQLICWGVSYYVIGVFGEAIAHDLGWTKALTYSGFSVALVVMGLASGLVGRLIDRHGGRWVMVAGSLLTAIACVALSRAHEILVYEFAWALLGLAMRMTLYDAAFATLARIGGSGAKRAIAQVTLLGGLASTVFWPIGHALIAITGWRAALLVYAACALMTLPLHWTIPKGARHAGSSALPGAAPLAGNAADRRVAGTLYLVIMTIGAFLNSGMSAHMISILATAGLGAGLAVWLSTLRGIGQSAARLCEVLLGRRVDPLLLGIIATSLLPFAFFCGFFAGTWSAAGAAFALGYGAGNGLLTIVRGAQPLVLFDPRSYGQTAGRLLAPGFYVAALAPILYAMLIERFGGGAALALTAALSIVALACAIALWWRFRASRTRCDDSGGKAQLPR